MTREETRDLVAYLRSLYPNWQIKDANQATLTVNAWYLTLQDYDYKIIQSATLAFIKSGKGGAFPPSVAEIIDIINTGKDETLNENQAWSLVYKAISRSTYGAEEEFAKLPPEVQKAVGSARNLREWAKGDERDINTVVASNFQRSYRTEVKRAKDIAAMPIEMRQVLGIEG